MKITFLASEANPFIKTGGLADVVYALAEQYVSEKHEVNIIIPFYSKIKNSIFIPLEYLGSFKMMLSWKSVEVKVCLGKYRGISYYFIENDEYFARGQIYGEGDDGERFAFFTMASIEVMKRFNIPANIVHLHDWQVGMLPCVVKENKDPYFKKSKFVFTIHNPAFQGIYDPDFILSYYQLRRDCYENGNIKMHDQCSTLKAGIVYSDKITTVSPTHREELLTADGGMNLDFILNIRKDDFVGILNGIDYNEFNPGHDKKIPATYNKQNYYSKKSQNKEALLAKFGLRNLGLPVYGLVSRLTWQKGIDLMYPLVRSLAWRGCVFLFLGSGEYGHEQGLEQLRKEFPDNVGIYIGYNDEIAHLIYAGSDFFLMPSLFEPCGLSQMISEAYGTLPIVRTTGGLKDSVVCYDGSNDDVANGFGFQDNNADEFIRCVSKSFDVYWNLPLRKRLIRNAMATDNSWKKSAEKYIQLYKSIGK